METCIRLGKYEEVKKLAVDTVAHVDKRKCYGTGLLYLKYLYAKFMADQKTNDSQTEESYEKFQETLNDFARIYGLDPSLVKKRLIKN